MIDNIIVRIIDMPYIIRGYTMRSPDGFYNIYLNSKYPIENQRTTYLHEIRHISNMDFDSFESIGNIERKAEMT